MATTAETLDKLLAETDLASLVHILLNRASHQRELEMEAAGDEDAILASADIRPVVEVLIAQYGFKHIRGLVEEIGGDVEDAEDRDEDEPC